MKKLTIRLSQRLSFVEFVIWLFDKGRYTHAAMALPDAPGQFYTFNVRGFYVEKKQHRCSRVDTYEIEVNQETLERLKVAMEEYRERASQYRYSTLSVFLAILRIPHSFKNRYYCSEFVAKELRKAGVMKEGKADSMILPNHLYEILEPDLTLMESHGHGFLKVCVKKGHEWIVVRLLSDLPHRLDQKMTILDDRADDFIKICVDKGRRTARKCIDFCASKLNVG